MKYLLHFLTSILILTTLAVNGAKAQLSLLDEYILGEMARENIPGLSVAVISGAEINLRSYGVR